MKIFSPGFEDFLADKDRCVFAFKILQEVLKEYGVDLTKNVKVLEIGSGSAVFLDYMKQKGVNAVGVDISPRGSTQSPQFVARIEHLPFLDESFDVVLSSQAFDPLLYDQDQDLMAREIARVLKHGGIYTGSTEHINVSPPKGLKSVPDLSGYQGYSIYKKF